MKWIFTRDEPQTGQEYVIDIIITMLPRLARVLLNDWKPTTGQLTDNLSGLILSTWTRLKNHNRVLKKLFILSRKDEIWL